MKQKERKRKCGMPGYIKMELCLLKGSFKDEKTFRKVLLINILFFGITYLISKAASIFAKKQYSIIESVNLDNIASKAEGELANIAGTAKSVIAAMAIMAVIFAIVEIILWAIAQWKINSILHDKKLSLKRFLLLNLMWMPAWVALFVIILAGGRMDTFQNAIFILMLVFLHFTLILYNIFAKEGRYGAIGRALREGFKIHKIVIPYIAIAIFYNILALVGGWFTLISQKFSQIANPLLLIMLFSWIQIYMKKNSAKLF